MQKQAVTTSPYLDVILISVDTNNKQYFDKQFQRLEWQKHPIEFVRLRTVDDTSFKVDFLTKMFFPLNYIGCSDSHHRAWKLVSECQDDNKWFLILEEDSKLNHIDKGDIETLCRKASQSNIDFFMLNAFSPSLKDQNASWIERYKTLLGEWSYMKYNNLDVRGTGEHTFYRSTNCFGFNAYAIKPTSARTLMRHILQIQCHCDGQIAALNKKNIIQSYCISMKSPYRIEQTYSTTDKGWVNRHVLAPLLRKVPQRHSMTNSTLLFALTMPSCTVFDICVTPYMMISHALIVWMSNMAYKMNRRSIFILLVMMWNIIRLARELCSQTKSISRKTIKYCAFQLASAMVPNNYPFLQVAPVVAENVLSFFMNCDWRNGVFPFFKLQSLATMGIVGIVGSMGSTNGIRGFNIDLYIRTIPYNIAMLIFVILV